MTFEQFQGTREFTDDISTTTGLDVGEGIAGFVYDSDLHIFIQGNDRYQLVIDGEEKVSSDLEMLERELYEFGLSEGLLQA